MAIEEMNTTGVGADVAPAGQTAEAPPRFGLKGRIPISRTNLVLAAMCVVGVGAVILVRRDVGPRKASAEQQQVELQVETAISQLDSIAPRNKDAKASALVNTVYYDTSQRQIPPWRLAGNPFVFTRPKPRKKPPGKAPSNGTWPKAAVEEFSSEEEKRAMAMAEAERLSLQSILMGPRGPMAMISNNLLGRGQNIRGWTVTEVRPREVVLAWRDEKHVLSMPE